CNDAGLFSGHFLPFDGLVSVVLELGLVFEDLAIDLVCEKIDGCVKVFIPGFAVQILAGEAYCDLGGVLKLFHGEHDLRVDDVVEMATDASHFARRVLADSRSDIQMTSSDAQVHINAPTC